jgi:amino acid adenylation domain-containing protein
MLEDAAMFEKQALEESIPARFDRIAHRHLDHPALVLGSTEITYGELSRRSRRLAGALYSVGVRPGQRVGLALDAPGDMVAAILAVLRVRGVYMPLDPAYPPDLLRWMVRDADPALLLTDLDVWSPIGARERIPVIPVSAAAESDELDDEPSAMPTDLSSLLYTSGSTGHPKGVLQQHRTVLLHVRNLTNRFRIRASDRHSMVASFSFDASTTDLFCALLNGAALVPIDVRRGGLSRLGEELAARRVTLFHSTPTVFRHIEAEPADLAHLRLVLLGGEPLVLADIERFARTFPPNCLLVNGYGTTETAGFLAWTILAGPGAAGPVEVVNRLSESADEVELLLRDPTTGEPTTGEGELCVRSDYLGVGYWNDPEGSARTFLRESRGAGAVHLYRSGDLARRACDGSLVLIGRADRQTKVRGQRVDVGQIEALIASIPGIANASVVTDPTGAELVAFVRAIDARDPGEKAVRAAVERCLPSYAVPSRVVSVDDLPLTPTGKVDLAALAARAARSLPAPQPTAPDGAGATTEQVIAAVWAAQLGLAAVSADANFYDLGGHSLLLARVHAELERYFGRKIPLYRLFEFPTVREFARFLDAPAAPSTVPADDVLAARARRRQRANVRARAERRRPSP